MTHDTTETVLRTLVAQHRDAAGPRIAVADHLAATGDAKRAGFIHEQLATGRALALGARDGKPVPFEVPAESPLYEDVRALAALGVTAALYHGGFADRVGIPWAAWIEHAEAIRAGWPVREVWLTTWPTFFERVPDGWVDRVEPAFYWHTAAECRAALEARWRGLTFALPKAPPADPPTLIEVPVSGADTGRIEDVRRHQGKVNAVSFLGHPPRSLLFRDVLVCVPDQGDEATVFRLLPARPGETFPDRFEACDFAEVFDHAAG